MTLTFFGFRRLGLSDTNWPAFENSLFTGTEEPGMQRYFFATCMRQGSWPLFSFHQASGSDDRENYWLFKISVDFYYCLG